MSDTRTEETDVNGQFLKNEIAKSGHSLGLYKIIKDEAVAIDEVLAELDAAGCNVGIFNGGTGISRRDTTYDVLSRRLDKTLDGFGEIFRMLSYQQVGSAAMLSRAVAGVFQQCIIFSTPGSVKAVQLAWEKLIAPEMKHLVFEITR